MLFSLSMCYVTAAAMCYRQMRHLLGDRDSSVRDSLGGNCCAHDLKLRVSTFHHHMQIRRLDYR